MYSLQPCNEFGKNSIGRFKLPVSTARQESTGGLRVRSEMILGVFPIPPILHWLERMYVATRRIPLLDE